jgi:hypothetical protein
MALDPLTGEQVAAQAAAHLAALRFGARLGELAAEELATATAAVRDAGGDPRVLVLLPAAAGLRELADWFEQGAP